MFIRHAIVIVIAVMFRAVIFFSLVVIVMRFMLVVMIIGLERVLWIILGLIVLIVVV